MLFVCLPLIGEARESLANKVAALAKIFNTARLHSELSQKTVAYDTGYDLEGSAHFSQALTIYGLNLARLLLLPKRFWLVFLPLLAVLVDCAELLALPATPSDTVQQIARLEAKFAALEREFASLKAERRTA